jgi:hypothetical protein
MKIFGREPAAYQAVIRLVLALVVTFGFSWLTADDAAAVYAVVLGLFGVVVVWTTRDKLLSAIETFVQAVGLLFIQYNANLTQDQLGIIVALAGAIGALWLRTQTSPVPTAVTRA